MQQQVFIGRNRNPFAVLFFTIITLGIYWLYWYYSINEEIRRHEPQVSVSPGLSLLSQFVPIASLISNYNTATRIQRMELVDGAPNQISPVVTIILLLFFGIGYVFQVQSHLNAHWDTHRLTIYGQQRPGAMPAPAQAYLAPPPAPRPAVVSDDGMWRWDGQRWLPNDPGQVPSLPPY
jgi:hypothetical protein